MSDKKGLNTEETNTEAPQTPEAKPSMLKNIKLKYVIYLVVIIILAYLLYQAYLKFSKNQECDKDNPKKSKKKLGKKSDKDSDEEEDDQPKQDKSLVPGFNLRKEITQLNDAQKKLLSQVQITE